MARKDAEDSKDLAASEAERRLAWQLHVELATRVSAVRLEAEQGLLSEALESLHALFRIAREALAEDPGAGASEAASTVVRTLNEVLRPFLTKWHPLLVAHDELRQAGTGRFEHEQAWPRNAQLRAELVELQAVLREVARHLAQRAGARSLVPDEPLAASR